MRPDVLAVFVKPPRPGEVKTRLAASLGAPAATALAAAFFEDSWRLAQALPDCAPVVAAGSEFREGEWLPPGAEVWLQGAGDLGERMERVARRALDAGARVLILGTDSPGLPPRFLEEARASLQTHDAALGPCADGGFYLLALRRCPAGLLSGLPWSTPDTLQHTEARLRAAGLTVRRIEPWFDVDLLADLEQLADRIRAGEISAPRTAAELARLGLLAARAG